jgi:hypothetical protein
VLNLNLGKEQPPEGLWSFDTRVLAECSVHAAAFPPVVLQRIIWARTANEQLEASLGSLRDGRFVEPAILLRNVVDLRKQVSGEIIEIERELRT